ncbi:MAG: aspartyl protease family protein [Sedimentisphaerales bacterium]|nr:aspartyl protease family protein [Sedimentisphaerales bacterium]
MKARLFFLLFVTAFLSVYCLAQEKVVPEPVLEGFRQQMKQIDTLKANYTVISIAGQSRRKLQNKVSYVKSGDKYSMSEFVFENDEQIGEKRTVYDGINVKQYDYNEKENINYGSLHNKNMHDVLITSNDIRRLVAGFGYIKKQYDENIINQVFKNMGTESVDGHDCKKIVIISPYLPGQKAHTYLWIEVQDEKYYLLKEACLIEDDSNQLLYQRKYVFDYSDAYPLPREIHYERFEIDSDGNRKPSYELNATIENFEINVPVEDSEFVYLFPEGTIVDTTSVSIDPEEIEDPNWTGTTKPNKNVIEANQPVLEEIKEFHYDVDSGVIFLPVHIHGKEYSFLLDTGSSNTIFDSSIKDLLGEPKRITRGSTPANPTIMQLFESPEVQVGPYKLPKGSEVICLDLSTPSMAIGKQVDGVLGMDFLKQHVIQIDFDENIISFLGQNEADFPGYEQQLDISYNSKGLPQLKGRLLDDIETKFIIDSGYNSTGGLDSEIFDKLIKSENIKTSESISVTAGGIQKSREARINQLFIGSYEYKDLIFTEENTGILGISFLARHAVILDFPNKKIYLKKGSQFNKKDELDMTGLALLRNSSGLGVHTVFQSSPAEKAGIKTGDIIVRIEGKDVDEYSYKQLKKLFHSGDGNELKMTIKRESELKEITIVLEREI